MPSAPLPHPWPRVPLNELHKAASCGSSECLLALLLDGSIDIDQVDLHLFAESLLLS